MRWRSHSLPQVRNSAAASAGPPHEASHVAADMAVKYALRSPSGVLSAYSDISCDCPKAAQLLGGVVGGLIAAGRLRLADYAAAVLSARPAGEEGDDGDGNGGRTADGGEPPYLVEDGAAWLIANGDTSDNTLFPRDKAYESCRVSDRVRGIWLRMEVPTDLGAVAAEMQRAGIPQAKRKPWERTAGDGGRSRGGGADGQPKKRPKRDFSKLHVTNVHLFDELLAPGAMADELDDED